MRLLVPDEMSPMPLLANTLTRFPEHGGLYSLPSSARLVGFLAIASENAVARADVATVLVKISDELSSGALGLRAGIPRGQTLWYGEPDKGWLTTNGERASGEAAATLAAVCGKLRAAFDWGAVSMCGAATACAAKQ